MNILFILPDFPYPVTTGGRSKVFNELLYLSESHQCDILCFGNPKNVDVHGLKAALPNVRLLNVIPKPAIFTKNLRVFVNLIQLLPPSLAGFNEKKFSYEIKKSILARAYDVIHYDIINMAQYIPLCKGIASVHSPNDATSLAYFRLAKQSRWSISKFRLLLSAYLLRKYEYDMYPRFTKIHVVSEVDKNYLTKVNSDINIDVIPIALDMNYKSMNNKVRDDSDFKKIICTGNFGNFAISKGTQDFISKAFPLILKKSSKVRLIVLGKNIDDKLMGEINNNNNIVYTEFVEDFNDFLLQADVILAPDYAGAPGAKTRVLQAMGLGLAVVGTSAAFEGIPIINGEHGFVYSSTSECVKFINELLANSGERAVLLGKMGKKMVLEEFSLKTIGPKYENMYINAINDFS